MDLEVAHPTLTHLLGYLNVSQWADAIRGKLVNTDIAWELLRVQDQRYGGSMRDEVKEVVALSDEDYREWCQLEKKP